MRRHIDEKVLEQNSTVVILLKNYNIRKLMACYIPNWGFLSGTWNVWAIVDCEEEDKLYSVINRPGVAGAVLQTPP